MTNSTVNRLNTDFNSLSSQIIGFTVDDILKIEPFKDAYSTAWFVIFMSFIAAFGLLVGIAFLYSFCDCLCSCCGCCGSSGSKSSNKVKNGNEDMEMEHRRK